uniref:Acetylornithine deacetylase/succinyl-diaminopimelate desuccinylase n=1 Tax=Uncultured bacterium HF130_AEPn_1 TaxID=663362 RepID=D0E8J1_UNCHF|nr:acetylornithine deacetylase/succinyl-diaminopimelate desuccinylase [uncultured bacterium HF130_AEPn_1]
MDSKRIYDYCDKVWEDSIISEITEYIKIPNKSPLFDPEWEEKGHMEEAVQLIFKWCKENAIEGMEMEIVRLPGRTPLIFMEVPGDSEDTVLLYGHLDKQPEMIGWDEDLGPWIPVLKGDKLYGRGGADDGYSAYASLTAIKALKEQGLPHGRCVIIIEACEESGSYDLPYYIDHLKERIGRPDLVICLDSGCGNYDQLWITTSLRGNIVGDLKVELISEGVHSGNASGIVPSSFRVAKQLISRIEDEKTGEILVDELHCEIPKERHEQAQKAADTLQEAVYSEFPFHPGVRPAESDLKDLILNRTWKPFLAVTGADGIPELANAGNVMRPETSLRLSMRIPPTCDPEKGSEALSKKLLEDPPYNSKLSFTAEQGAIGWNAPPVAEWLEDAAESASQNFFGAGAVYMGEGGTIPFMGMLGEKFPGAQFMITGVLGPKSNAHGPNEFLHIPTGKKVTACMAEVLYHHFKKEDA